MPHIDPERRPGKLNCVSEGQIEILDSAPLHQALSRSFRQFGHAQTGYFHLNDRAIARVEIQQCVYAVVPAEFSVAVQHREAQIGASEPFDVHVKKREVNGGIAVPETFVKFYAIDYLNSVEEVNMLGSEVSMTVADVSFCNPALEKAPAVPEKSAARLLYKVEVILHKQVSNKRLQLAEILLRVELYDFAAAVTVDLLIALARSVKLSQTERRGATSASLLIVPLTIRLAREASSGSCFILTAYSTTSPLSPG